MADQDLFKDLVDGWRNSNAARTEGNDGGNSSAHETAKHKRPYHSKIRVKKDKESLKEDSKNRQKLLRTQMKALFLELANVIRPPVNPEETTKAILQAAISYINQCNRTLDYYQYTYGTVQVPPDWTPSASLSSSTTSNTLSTLPFGTSSSSTSTPSLDWQGIDPSFLNTQLNFTDLQSQLMNDMQQTQNFENPFSLNLIASESLQQSSDKYTNSAPPSSTNSLNASNSMNANFYQTTSSFNSTPSSTKNSLNASNSMNVSTSLNAYQAPSSPFNWDVVMKQTPQSSASNAKNPIILPPPTPTTKISNPSLSTPASLLPPSPPSSPLSSSSSNSNSSSTPKSPPSAFYSYSNSVSSTSKSTKRSFVNNVDNMFFGLEDAFYPPPRISQSLWVNPNSPLWAQNKSNQRQSMDSNLSPMQVQQSPSNCNNAFGGAPSRKSATQDSEVEVLNALLTLDIKSKK